MGHRVHGSIEWVRNRPDQTNPFEGFDRVVAENAARLGVFYELVGGIQSVGEAVGDAAADFIPGLGQFKAGYEGITGRSFTKAGENVGGVNRAIGFAVLGVTGFHLVNYAAQAGRIGAAAKITTEITHEVRSFNSFDAFKSALGPAGSGKVWHHIVEQRGDNVKKFGAKVIHSTINVIPVANDVNQKIANYYSRIRPFTNGLPVRKWLGAKSLEEQRAFGLRILEAVQSGDPLP